MSVLSAREYGSADKNFYCLSLDHVQPSPSAICHFRPMEGEEKGRRSRHNNSKHLSTKISCEITLAEDLDNLYNLPSFGDVWQSFL